MKARIRISLYAVWVLDQRIMENDQWEKTRQHIKALFMNAVANNDLRSQQAMRYVLRKYMPSKEREQVDSMNEEALLSRITYIYYEALDELERHIQEINQATVNQ